MNELLALFSDVSIPELVSMVSSIAACISTIVAIVALKQIKRQRESAYMPELFLAFKQADAIVKLSAESSDVQYRQYVKDKETDLHSILLSFENVGLGTAKDVKLTWSFDHKKAFKLVEKKFPENFRWDSHSFDLLSLTGETLFTSLMYSEGIDETDYDFILPRSQERFNLGASIPNLIVDLFVAYGVLNTRILHDDVLKFLYREDFSDFPKVKAKVSYSDIGNKKYGKVFSVNFSLSSCHYENGLDLEELDELSFSVHTEINFIK